MRVPTSENHFGNPLARPRTVGLPRTLEYLVSSIDRLYQPNPVWKILETAYLATDDPRAQSGFRGDAARWEAARRVIVDAIDHDGAFLDVGCANGLLMESIADWADAAGYSIEPYGIDISPALAHAARLRLPHWAQRIFTGDAMTWHPPRPFDFARTELVYVPDDFRAAYLLRLLDHVIVPGGRLIVCSYGSATQLANRAEPVAEMLKTWGFRVAGQAEAPDPATGVIITRVAWIEAE